MEEKELEQIISKFEGELRFVAFRYVRDWMTVDDIMQEVYVKIFLKWNSFKDNTKIKSWLYRITCNQCIDYLRSRVVRPTVLTENLEDLQYTSKESVESEMIESFERERLYQHIDALPTDYKQTLSLYYLKDYSYQEICEVLCKDITFVKNKLFRGRRLLKKLYEKNELSF
ncbi:RNA polymerase sigma factor [Ferdinandcohnia sp. Marseille-Q9671]